MSILRRLEARGADPTLPWGSSAIPTNGQIGLNAAGVPMNEDVALSISTVFACVKALADDVSSLDLCAYLKTDDRTKTKADNPPAIVSNPWPEGTLQDWLTQVMVSLALRGNFFGEIVDRDRRGYPTMVKPLHPDDVTARRSREGKREYRFKGTPMDLDSVFHIPAMLLPGSFIGLNPIEYMRSSWGLTAAAERYGGAFFANSANPSGVIEIAEDLDENETMELARAWKMAHQGIGNAQYPAVLTGGATWKPVSINPDDAQFLQTRDFQRVEIAGWFGIPLHRLGLQDRTSSWGTGIEQMELGYIANTLGSWIKRIESYLTLPAITPRTITVKFDLSSRLRGDTLQRYQAYTLARNGGWLNIDEIREKEDMPALPDELGQDHWAPLNFAPINKILDGTAGDSGGIGGGVDQSPDAPPAPSPNGQPRSMPTVNVYNNVPVPEVRVAAHMPPLEPHFEVPVPEVRVEVPAPVVTVNPVLTAEVRAPDVHNHVIMPEGRPTSRRVVRDAQGRISGVEET